MFDRGLLFGPPADLMGSLVSPLGATCLSIVTGMLLFTALDLNALEALYFFFIDPIRDFYGLSELLLKVSPIVLCALGLLFCYKAGVWNIGAEGQFVIGALSGGWAALALGSWESSWAPLLVLISGMAGGAVWAIIAASLKNYFRASEILTTIMLNYIAVHLLMYCVNGPLKDPSGFNFPESAIFAVHTLVPQFNDEYRINWGLFVPLILSLIVYAVFRFSRLGFEIEILGSSEAVAKNAGINAKILTLLVLAICGAFAGLAGGLEVAGPVQQLIPQLSLGYGYAAIICIYLGRMSVIGVILSAMLLGVTYVGAENLQLQYELPNSIAAVFQGLILFYLLAIDHVSGIVARKPT